jgi:hypothetical protein
MTIVVHRIERLGGARDQTVSPLFVEIPRL